MELMSVCGLNVTPCKKMKKKKVTYIEFVDLEKKTLCLNGIKDEK